MTSRRLVLVFGEFQSKTGKTFGALVEQILKEPARRGFTDRK